VKRIHFTAEDLAQIRVAATIGVAAETFDCVKLSRLQRASEQDPLVLGRPGSG